MKTKGIILANLLLLVFSAAAQDNNLLTSGYSYRQYTTQDGLPGMIMQCLFKDSKGFLWQGTLKGGSRFDGFDFEPYALDVFVNVERIEEVNGEVRFRWGKVILYPETGKQTVLSDSLRLNYYNSTLLPADYFIGEKREGKKYLVQQLEDDSISEIVDIPQLQGLYYNKVYLDRPHNLLYIPCHREKRVYIHDLATNSSSQVIENVVLESFFNHSQLGLLGIGAEGIYRLSDGKAEMYVPLEFTEGNKTAVETRSGDIYVKDYCNIYRISGARVEHLYHNPAMTIWDMVLDSDENLWAATNQGLYNFFRFDFKEYQIRNHTIRGISQDDAGTYWMAGDSEDIFSLSGEDFRRVKYPLRNAEEVSFENVFSHGGRTYFLITGGILIHENGRFHWAEASQEHHRYGNIAAYGDHLLVSVSNASKIVEITPDGKPVRTRDGEELQQMGFYDVATDSLKRIIAAGYYGISMVEDDSVSLLKSRSFAQNDIVCTDARNRIFSASRKYLHLVQGDSVVTIHSFDNDQIMGLLPFDRDHMIVATLKGIYIFNATKYLETGDPQMLFYNHNNGMNGIEPAYSGMFLDQKGLVWMVTSDRIVSFDPQKLLRQVAAPSLLARNAAVSRDNVEWEDFAGIANAKFPHHIRNFRFSFIGLCYSSVENVRYHYRLKGFQDGWSEPSKNREATFNNLRPGNYLFEVYADSGTDSSRSETLSIPFTVRPAFWQTWWFVLLTAVAVIGLGYAVFAIRERNHRILQEYLETELTARTGEVHRQKEEIEIKNRDITDSITYAQRIQFSVLPTTSTLTEHSSGAFIFYRPRDIVSGDFYWFEYFPETRRLLIVCADSTGHGVPGAFISLIGTTLIKDIALRPDVRGPADILYRLDENIQSTLNQNRDSEQANDGMDIIVCEINTETHFTRISSAMRPFIVYHEGTPTTYKSSRSSIGGQRFGDKTFTTTELQLAKGDTIYMFTDGYTDQFGGPSGKKLKMTGLQNILNGTCDRDMDEQHRAVKESFDLWKGNDRQTDDVLMIGVKI
ncbi:MAG: SpoIIE family protein phosphatase [Bacteroidales bacterium]|jgi:serine phosphatase RsbU (regulator of sigma subunit)|nr:SpoIIE family protein phosphatase [Bacteroidales bacterium]